MYEVEVDSNLMISHDSIHGPPKTPRDVTPRAWARVPVASVPC